MQLTEIDAASFHTALASDQPLLVMFGAPWCPICRQMERPLAALADERIEDLTVVKVDIDRYPELGDDHNVWSLPTVVLFTNGQPSWRTTGSRSLGDLRTAVDSAVAQAAPPPSVVSPSSAGSMSTRHELPVAVIGAGPVGLAAAAELVERGLPFVVLEAGTEVGASIREWSHVQLFSPWSFDVAPAARRLLEVAGWDEPPDASFPTGGELVARYLEPLARLAPIAGAIRTRARVIGITRDGIDKLRTDGRADRPFVLTIETPDGLERLHARAVVDATGTWRTPNPLGAAGQAALGEAALAARISRGIPDVAGVEQARFAGRRVAVVGSGHSAQNLVRDLAAVQLADPDTRITWVVRRHEPGTMFGGAAADRLPERGRLGDDSRRLVDDGRVWLESGFRVDQVVDTGDGVVLVAVDGRRVGPFDEVVTATGFRPDTSFLSELRLDLDPAVESSRALAPLIDPNVHSCGSVPPHGAAELSHPEPGLYVVGSKSYGRAPTFLLATGYEQVRSVVAELAGDHTAATDVRLVLPETGVCSRTTATPATVAEPEPEPEPELVGAASGASACCG